MLYIYNEKPACILLQAGTMQMVNDSDDNNLIYFCIYIYYKITNFFPNMLLPFIPNILAFPMSNICHHFALSIPTPYHYNPLSFYNK